MPSMNSSSKPKVLRLLDGDDAVLADLVDGVGDDLADRVVGGRDRSDLGDLGLVVDTLTGMRWP